MDPVQLMMLALGLIGIGYGGFVFYKGHLEIYHVRRGEFLLYTGPAAQFVGGGIAVAGLGSAVLGVAGFSTIPIMIGLLCSTAYFVSRYMANRLQAGSSDFSLPDKDRTQ